MDRELVFIDKKICEMTKKQALKHFALKLDKNK